MLRKISRRWNPLSLTAVLALAAVGRAADVAVEFDVQPRILRLGEAAQATITVHGDRNPASPPLGGLADCDVTGPSVNTQVSIVNGHMDQSASFVYQIVPRRSGTIKIGPINYTLGTQVYQLKEVELNVTNPTAGGATGGEQGVALSELVAARLEIAPTNLYQNQIFELYLSILHRDIRLDNSFSLLNWDPKGFSMSAFHETPSQRAMVNGQVFEVRQFRCQARALTVGHFRLAPTVRGAVVMQGEHRQRGGAFGDPFFDRFFENSLFNRPETRPLDIPTQPLDLTVHALPETGRPANFNGAVGQFTLAAQVKPDDSAVGDPVTLTVHIAGHGNFDAIAFTMLNNSELFKTYDAKLIAKELDETQSNGRKTFEQVIIPRNMDSKRIPQVGFSFFDPAQGQYDTLNAGPFDLKLHPSAAGMSVMASAPTPSASTPLGHDIAYLKPAPNHWRTTGETEVGGGPLFWPLQAVPPLIVLAAFMLARRRDARAGDVRLVRREQAPRNARRALRAAEQARTRGQRAEFFEALAEALRSYFGHRLNLPPGDVTADRLLSQLAAAQVAATLSNQVCALFELCDRERFGASGSAFDVETARRTVDDTAKLLRQFEKVRL